MNIFQFFPNIEKLNIGCSVLFIFFLNLNFSLNIPTSLGLFFKLNFFLLQNEYENDGTKIVPPFPIYQRYLKECDGYKFKTYIDWLNIVSAITLSFCPALSLPGGFTKNNLPVGIQVIAPNKEEGKLLAGSRFIEKVIKINSNLPIDPKHAKNQ